MSALEFGEQEREDISRLRDCVFQAFLKSEDRSWVERFLTFTQVALYDVMTGEAVPDHVFDILLEAARREERVA